MYLPFFSPRRGPPPPPTKKKKRPIFDLQAWILHSNHQPLRPHPHRRRTQLPPPWTCSVENAAQAIARVSARGLPPPAQKVTCCAGDVANTRRATWHACSRTPTRRASASKQQLCSRLLAKIQKAITSTRLYAAHRNFDHVWAEPGIFFIIIEKFAQQSAQHSALCKKRDGMSECQWTQ